VGEGGCACGACGARCDDKDGAGGLAAVATTAEAATSPFLYRSPPVYLRGVRSAGAAHALPIVHPRAFVDGFKSQRLGLCGMPLSRCHACAADARKFFFVPLQGHMVRHGIRWGCH
jgi:hypothetical protein